MRTPATTREIGTLPIGYQATTVDPTTDTLLGTPTIDTQVVIGPLFPAIDIRTIDIPVVTGSLFRTIDIQGVTGYPFRTIDIQGVTEFR